VGTVSGHSTDKSKLFDVFYGETGSAPMINECPVNIECIVIHEVNIKHRQIFFEVIQTYVNDEYIMEKKRPVDLIKLDLIIYSLDNNYYSIGKIIGEDYKEASKHKINV